MKTIPAILSLTAVLLPLQARAEAPPAGSSPARLVRQAYVSAEGPEREYFVYLPTGYDDASDAEKGRRWPVMLFLHGNGERGDSREDLDWVLAHGPLYEAWVYKRDLPFIILSPQLPLYGFDKTVDYIRDRDPSTIPRRLKDGVPPRPETFPTPDPLAGANATAAAELPLGPEGPPKGWFEIEADLLKILDQGVEIYRGDAQRVYLTGLSYGGFGTWYLASRHPGRFAAIAPVVGWGHPDLMKPLAERQMPVWAFAGGRDPAVLEEHFFAGLNKLEELGHDDVRFTVHEDMGHDTWRRVYAGQDLYDWLLSHRLEGETRPAFGEDGADEPPPGVEQLLPRGRIAAVVEPVFVPAPEAEIAADAWVLGVEIDGEARAYSLNLLNSHEVVNDTVGGRAVAAVW